MSEPYSTVDASGSYLSSIVPKQGRNEVQFYPLIPVSGTSKALFDETNVSRHELQTDSDIIAVTWLNEHGALNSANKKSTKKRPNPGAMDEVHEIESTDTKRTSKNGGNDQHIGSSGSSDSSSACLYLVVALSSGEIWTFSPTSDTTVSQVSAQEPIVAMTAAKTDNRIWALGDSGSIYEIDIIDGTALHVVRFGKKYPDVTFLTQCHYKPPKKKRVSAESELLYVASSRLFLVSGTKSRSHCVAEYTRHNDELREAQGNISFLVNVPGNDSTIVVARTNSAVLQLCNVADNQQEPFSFNCSSSDIINVRALSDEFVVAYTRKGAEVFGVRDEFNVNPIAVVKPQNKKVYFENFFYNSRVGLVGVWYDGNQPQFTQVSTDLELCGTYQIPIDLKDFSDQPETGIPAEINFTADSEEQISNVSASELSSTLLGLLSSPEPSKSAVLSLCTANDDEENIRSAIRQLAYSDNYTSSVENLLEVVSAHVSQDPSKKTSLSLWLRWILLAHGGHIAKQKRFADNLRGMQKSLNVGMSLMPKLLALQGRLQLLKSQAELRNAVANGDASVESSAIDEQEKDLEAFNDTVNNPINIEESLVYANGESDEFEDALSTFAGDENGVTENGEVDAITYENGEADEIAK